MMQGLESFVPMLQVVAAARGGEVCVPVTVATAIGGLVLTLLGANATQWKASQKRDEQDRESARRMEERADRMEERVSQLIDQDRARRMG